MSLASLNLRDLKLSERLVFSGRLSQRGDAKNLSAVRPSMIKSGVLVLVASLLGACAGATSNPMEAISSSTLVGDFGGNQVILHATTAGAEIQFSCMAVSVSNALTTDGTGHFTASGGRRRTGGAVSLVQEPPIPVRLDGHAYLTHGGTIQLVVADIPEEPGAPIGWADTLTLVRDRPANIFLCP